MPFFSDLPKREIFSHTEVKKILLQTGQEIMEDIPTIRHIQKGRHYCDVREYIQSLLYDYDDLCNTPGYMNTLTDIEVRARLRVVHAMTHSFDTQVIHNNKSSSHSIPVKIQKMQFDNLERIFPDVAFHVRCLRSIRESLMQILKKRSGDYQI
jgi:hypothetical protein